MKFKKNNNKGDSAGSVQGPKTKWFWRKEAHKAAQVKGVRDEKSGDLGKEIQKRQGQAQLGNIEKENRRGNEGSRD